MSELSFLIVTPHALRKGQAGAILSRLLSRTDLVLAGARVFAGDKTFADSLADTLLKMRSAPCPPADYIRKEFVPAKNGRKRTFLVLVLKGENAVRKVSAIAGPVRLSEGAGTTIRDSFAEIVRDADGKAIFFEPCVLVPESKEEVETLLPLLKKLASETSNIVENSAASDGSGERTLVMFKPENWRRPSIRPGAILDIFTRTGLVLAGCKIHHFSLAQALDFYGPVRDALRAKLAPKIALKARAVLEKEFGIALREEGTDLLLRSAGWDFADDQFHQIVEFMSGVNPVRCPAQDAEKPGPAQCMVLIFEGRSAVSKVRDVLGPTDPSKASGGTVRGEFGTNVMINAAHASDSPESFVRESKITEIDKNDFASVPD